MKILIENLRQALSIALREQENQKGYESAFERGLKEAIAAIDRGERIEVR